MYNTHNQSFMHGGGVKLRVHPVLVKTRANSYIRTRWKTVPAHLSIEKRQTVSFVLNFYFGFETKEVSEFVKKTPQNTNRDLKVAKFYFEKNKKFRDNVLDLYDYILYNTKYIVL